MKTTIISITALCLGLVSGWYLGYIQPMIQTKRELLANTGMTEAQIVRKNLDIMNTIQNEDRSNVAICSAALVKIEFGKMDDAKKILISTLANYYRTHGPPNSLGKTVSAEQLKTLKLIETTAQHSPAVKEVIDQIQKMKTK
jgi:hypothetical protein